MTREEIADKISDLLNLKLSEHPLCIENNHLNIDFRRNKEHDNSKIQEIPDGFLYFPYFMDIDIVDEKRVTEYKEIIKEIMFCLWSEKCQIVVASDFESELPHEGGYSLFLNQNHSK